MNDQKSLLSYQPGKVSKSARFAAMSLAMWLGLSPLAHAEVYYGRIDLAGYQFFNTNNDHNAGVVDAFVPLVQWPEHLFYVNFRGVGKSQSAYEGNLGAGIRQVSFDNQRLSGLYGFFDRRKTDTGNYFNQTVFGGEYWYNKFFIGGNAYIPIGTKERRADLFNHIDLIPVTDDLTDNIFNLEAAPGFEKALTGFDAEVGYEILPGLTTFVGGYMFSASDVKNVAGPKARVTYDWTHVSGGSKVLGIFDKISLESEVRHDQQRGTNWYGGLRFSVGMGKTPALDGAARHMMDPVRRDIGLVTQGYHLDVELIKNLTIAEVNNWDDLVAANKNDTIGAILITDSFTLKNPLALSDGKTLTGDRLQVATNDGQISFNATLKSNDNNSVLFAENHDLLQVDSVAMIYDLGLHVNDPAQHAAITNLSANNDIEKLHIDNINSNGAVELSLNKGSQAHVWINNSTFDLDGRQAAGLAAPEYNAAINFNANGGAIIIKSFQGNTITTTNMHGIANNAERGGEIIYDGYFGANTITINSNKAAKLPEFYAINNTADNATINFEKFVISDNKLSAGINDETSDLDKQIRNIAIGSGAVTYNYITPGGQPSDSHHIPDDQVLIQEVATIDELLRALDNAHIDVIRLTADLDLTDINLDGGSTILLHDGVVLTSDRMHASYNNGEYDMLLSLGDGDRYSLTGTKLKLQVSRDNSILDLKIEDENNAASITNSIRGHDYDGFGYLYIDNVAIDGALKLKLNTDKQSGILQVIGSQFGLANNPLKAGDAAVNLVAENGAIITVKRFEDNKIFTDGHAILNHTDKNGKIKYDNFDFDYNDPEAAININNVSYVNSEPDNLLTVQLVESEQALRDALSSNINIALITGRLELKDGPFFMSGGIISGGEYTFAYNGEITTTVQLSDTRGELIAQSGEDLIQVSGQDNIIEGISLTVDSADNTALAAITDESNTALGLKLINVDTNGRIIIDIDGAGRTGHVTLTDLQSDVNYVADPAITADKVTAALTLSASNGGELTVDGKGSRSHSVNITTAGNGVVGLKGITEGGSLTINNLSAVINTAGDRAHGVELIASSSSPEANSSIAVENSFINSSIITQDGGHAIAIEATSVNNDNDYPTKAAIAINNSFTESDFVSNGSFSSAISMLADGSNSEVNIADSFNNNHRIIAGGGPDSISGDTAAFNIHAVNNSRINLTRSIIGNTEIRAKNDMVIYIYNFGGKEINLYDSLQSNIIYTGTGYTDNFEGREHNAIQIQAQSTINSKADDKTRIYINESISDNTIYTGSGYGIALAISEGGQGTADLISGNHNSLTGNKIFNDAANNTGGISLSVTDYTAGGKIQIGLSAGNLHELNFSNGTNKTNISISGTIENISGYGETLCNGDLVVLCTPQ